MGTRLDPFEELMPTVEHEYAFAAVHTSLPFRTHGWRYLFATLP